MKHIVRTSAIILGLSLVLTISALAQSQSTTETRGNRGGGGRGGFGYDTSAVTTINATVESVETTAGRGNNGDNIRLSVTVGADTIRVNVGPASYLAEQKITINAKDKLKIKGSKRERNGNVMITAAEITKGTKTWTLRDDTGAAKWAPAPSAAPAGATAAPKTN